MAHTRRKKDSQESYIYLQARGGLNDCLNQLAICTAYAVKHRYSILLEMTAYKTTELDSMFDFSKYPVKIYTDVKRKKEELKGRPVEPAYMKQIQDKVRYVTRKNGVWRGNHGRPLRFNLSKTFPRDVVLIYAAGGGGNPLLENAAKRERHLFEYIRFTKSFLDEYRRVKDAAKIPDKYIAIHLRATDMKLKIHSKIHGATAAEEEALKKMKHSNNSHTAALDTVSAFIAMNPGTPVYSASDNVRLLEKLKAQHGNIVTTYSEKNTTNCESNRECKRIHAYNSENPNVLRGALIDLLLLVNATKLMTSAGGFSRLAAALWRRKDTVKKLLAS
jgi:hypothetical protein